MPVSGIGAWVLVSAICRVEMNGVHVEDVRGGSRDRTGITSAWRMDRDSTCIRLFRPRFACCITRSAEDLLRNIPRSYSCLHGPPVSWSGSVSEAIQAGNPRPVFDARAHSLNVGRTQGDGTPAGNAGATAVSGGRVSMDSGRVPCAPGRWGHGRERALERC